MKSKTSVSCGFTKIILSESLVADVTCLNVFFEDSVVKKAFMSRYEDGAAKSCFDVTRLKSML